MREIEFVLDPKADPARVWSEHLGPNAPDLASGIFQHLRAECDRDAGATCPVKGHLVKGRCPAGSCNVCPYSGQAGTARSLHSELGRMVDSSEAEKAAARERDRIRAQAAADEAARDAAAAPAPKVVRAPVPERKRKPA